MKDWQEVPGMFNPEAAQEYNRLLNLIPDGSFFVEVGCFKGRSLCSVAETINRKNLSVLVVDLWGIFNYHTPPPGVSHANQFEIFQRNIRAFGIDENVSVYCGELFHVKKYFTVLKHETPMLIFIDADHSRPGICRDIVTSKQIIGKSGIICGHDYLQADCPDVKPVVDEFFGDRVHVFETVWSVQL